ncbi:MAG TPA: amidotransferase 1, exosortase A system-associated [Gammaproteobacteria bacterium]|nr:amidotransferase 1, exosortase A system-associated [Gammaproteobacteria bacterium]
MCGLTGIFDTRSTREVDRDLLVRMNESLFHRGPDEGGIHTEPGLGLGHRRLSIIDRSGGQQPLFNEDGSVVVVFNGEIYNFAELAKALRQKGHTFRTHSDTEVIVHAWEEWGEACVEHFRGMFVFAIWDSKQEQLFIARDRLGIKPLYYSMLPNGHFIFGSELKALLQHPDLPRAIEPTAVEDYFAYGYVPEPKTILSHAHKLSPGYTLSVTRNGRAPVCKQYWDVPFEALPKHEEAEYAKELADRMTEAVKIRMIAEVPLGAFLSGGLDSSAVVAMMAGLSDDPVNTCSISFADPRYDESGYANEVAKQYNTQHTVWQVDSDDFDLIDRLAMLYDEPYADSSAIPTYRVCELAKKKVTVALSGDGGDEILAGYRRYQWFMREQNLRDVFPQGFRNLVFGGLGKIYPKALWAPRVFRAKALFQSLAKTPVESYFDISCVLKDSLRQQLFSPSFRSELQGYHALDVLKGHDKNSPAEHPLSRMQYLDMKTYLPGDILTKVDRASMAHALEVRVPLLDHKVVEWTSGLSPDLKLRGSDGKYLFKKAMASHLSQDLMYRKKQGFAVPIAQWFRGPLRERVRASVLSDCLLDTGMFDRRFLTQLIDDHQSGLQDHSAVLWSLFMYESFQRQVLGGQ